jgi:flagellar assembly protein FliH
MSWWGDASGEPVDRVVRGGGDAAPWGWDELPGVPAVSTEHMDPSEPVAHVDPELLQAEREAGEEAGFALGLAEGEARARAEFESAVAALDGFVTDLEAQADARAAAAEERIRALALGVARVLLDREVRTDPSEMVLLVRRALSIFPPDVPVKVRLHPEDLSMLARPQHGESTPPSMGRAGPLQWSADAELERGDVMVEAPERIVDGRVTPCIERIWEEMSDV